MEKKTLRIGIYGMFRGLDIARELVNVPNARVVAICDRNDYRLEAAKRFCAEDVRCFYSYEKMLDWGQMDVVVLTNTYHQHARCAIAALEQGFAVFSETAPAATLKETVELVEAVERTGGVYALAENYPHIRACRELTRVYQTGILGSVSYAEGEYIHPMDPKEGKKYVSHALHWRNFLPPSYYSTHSLAPLMRMTGHMPKRVIGKQALTSSLEEENRCMAALMLIETDQGALFRIFGSAHFGCMENWYRLGCDKGSVETVRGSNDYVRLVQNPWQLETPAAAHEQIYLPTVTEVDKAATNSGRRDDDHGHWGGDQSMLRELVNDVIEGRTPYMDVYRSAALTSVGILGWRSILQDSVQLEIPDFRKKEERDRVREDDLSPFPNENGETTLPHRYKQ